MQRLLTLRSCLQTEAIKKACDVPLFSVDHLLGGCTDAKELLIADWRMAICYLKKQQIH
jgi:hypothetical protein